MTRKVPAPRRKTSSPSPDGPSDLWAALGLTLLAWLHRLALLHSNRDRDWPFTVFYEGDAETFFQHARAFLDGRLYDQGLPFHPPGFPAVLAGVHHLLGAGHGVREIPHFMVKAVLALFASVGIGLLYALVRPYLGRTAALLAALLAVYHFGLSVLAIAPVSEGLYATLLVAVLLLWTRTVDSPLSAPGTTPQRPLVAGFAVGVGLGLLALVRAEAQLLVVLLASLGGFSGWQRYRTARRALLPALVLIAGFGLALAPWTIRNAVRLHELNTRLAGQLAEPLPTFVPVTIYGPLNLALANQDGADGSFSPAALTARTGSDQLSLTDPEHLRYLLHGDALAWAWIRSHPSAFVRLVGRKWLRLSEALTLGFTQWNWPGGLVGTRHPVDVFVPDQRPLPWLLVPLLLFGLGLAWRAPGWRAPGWRAPDGPRRWAILVLLLTSVSLTTTALFFGYVRQGLLILPFWLTLVALVPAVLVRRFAADADQRPPRLLLRGLALAAAVLLALEGWGARADRNYLASGSTVDGRLLNRDDIIRIEVLQTESP